MDMAAIFYDGVEPFEQIGNILLTEGPMWNLVKIAQAVSERKTFKNYTILYICLCWGFTAQSTQWGHVKRGQFT